LPANPYGVRVMCHLTTRIDVVGGFEESYGYDSLNRLLTVWNNTSLAGASCAGTTATVENSFTYDMLGDMLSKVDVGTYSYPAAGPPSGGAGGPHAVRQIVAAGTSDPENFLYDANGNELSETDATTGDTIRSLTWTIFDMPATVTFGGKTIGFQYDADHNRVLRTQAKAVCTIFYASWCGRSLGG